MGLLCTRLEEMVAEAASYASTLKKSSPTTKDRSRRTSSGPDKLAQQPPPPPQQQQQNSPPHPATDSLFTHAGSPPGGATAPATAAATTAITGQTLLVGKALTSCIAELAKGQTAVFASSDSIPSNLAASLTMLPGAKERIDQLLEVCLLARACSCFADLVAVQGGAGPELQRALIFWMNLLKHLCAGYLRDNPTRVHLGLSRCLALLAHTTQLHETVQQCKDWAGKVIRAMKVHEQSGACDTAVVSGVARCPHKSSSPLLLLLLLLLQAREALRDLHKHIVTKVVLCCGGCNKAISGTYTTADGAAFVLCDACPSFRERSSGVAFHNTCFKCSTCGKASCWLLLVVGCCRAQV